MLVPEIDSNSISQLYDHFTWDHQYLGVVGVPNFEKYTHVRLPDVVKTITGDRGSECTNFNWVQNPFVLYVQCVVLYFCINRQLYPCSPRNG